MKARIKGSNIKLIKKFQLARKTKKLLDLALDKTADRKFTLGN